MKCLSVIGVVITLVATGCGSGRQAAASATTAPNPHMAVPTIVVTKPAPGAVVKSAFTVSGTLSAPAVTIEVLRRGRVLARRTVPATPQGTFRAQLRATPGSATLVARTTEPAVRVDVAVTVSP